MLKQYSKFLDAVEKVFKIILFVLLSVMALIMVYQVILRYVFKMPNVWAEELVTFMFAWVCFLGAGICMRHNSHLKVDFLISILPEKIRHIWQTIIYFASTIVTAILFYISIPMVKQVVGKTSLGAHVPQWIPNVSVTVGCFFIVLFGIEMTLKELAVTKECFSGKEEKK